MIKAEEQSKKVKTGFLSYIDMVIDYLNEKYLLFRYRKEAAETIRQAEELISDINIPAYQVLLEVNKNIQNPLIAEAILKLRNGKPRYIAYEKIFPEEVIKLLKTAEVASLPPNKVIVEYSKIREEIEISFSKITGKIKSALISFLVFWLAGKFVIGLIVRKDFVIKGVSIADILNSYVKVFDLLLLIPLFFYIFFGYERIAKQTNPIMRKIYTYFQALKLLSVFKIANEIGLKTNKILEIYAGLDDELKIFIRRLPQTERNAIGVGKLLKRYLTGIEAILLSKAIELGRVEDYITKIARRRLASIEEATENLVENLSRYSSVLQFIPLAFVVMIFLRFLITVMNLSGISTPM